jgi:hypothetical protein
MYFIGKCLVFICFLTNINVNDFNIYDVERLILFDVLFLFYLFIFHTDIKVNSVQH